jgi:glycosyltransferase involved in cell wall biosynthesis
VRIAVYAICLNEEAFAARFCESAKAADLVLVADTGSTDGTVGILERHGAVVRHILIKPWRFDDARNVALALLPGDVDVCVSLDLDEVLLPGWREEIERVWETGINRMRYEYDWSAGVVFQGEKIHARHGFRWSLACHERLVADRTQEVWASTDMRLIAHYPDASKARTQYLDLLRISIEENPTEPRNAFYYARELCSQGDWGLCIAEAQRYLALPKANWPDERCHAMRLMGKAYERLGLWEAALKWLRNATAEAPETREPWYELALCCYRMNRWPEALGAALTCLSITRRSKLYTVDPFVWGAAPHDMAAVAAFNLGIYTISAEHARKAVQLEPDNLKLRQNLELCERTLAA